LAFGQNIFANEIQIFKELFDQKLLILRMVGVIVLQVIVVEKSIIKSVI
jgi:hypothetical protein